MATNILVVEDQRAVAGALRMRLRGLGYGVLDIAKDGKEAIEKAAELRPDLILMDIRLGDGIDGIEAAHRIRSQLDIPVVYVTAYADHDLLDRARSTHPAGFINKPFTTKDLLTTINLALSQETEHARPMHQIREAVLTSDRNGRISFINAGAERVTGWNRQVVLGRPLSEALTLLYGMPRAAADALIAEVLAGGQERVIPPRAGSTSKGRDVLAPLNDARGELFGVALHFGADTAESGIAGMQRMINACRSMLDQTPFGVVLVEEDLRVAHINARASEIVARGGPVTVRDGLLSTRDPKGREALLRLVQDAADQAALASDPELGEVLTLGGADERTVLIVSPTGTPGDFAEQPLVAVMLFDLALRPRLSTSVLRDVYGLTRSEVNLVQALVGGCSLEDGAAALGISVNTARTHLKHIFNKTGAKRQSELIHQIETGPASVSIRLHDEE